MPDGSNTFQTVVLWIFLVFLVLGVLLFAGVLPGFRDTDTYGGEVTLWGTIPFDTITPVLNQVGIDYRDNFTLTYVAKSPSTYESDLIQALAAGKGPDLFMLPQDLIVKHEDKVFLIPPASLSERMFMDTFIEGSELYVTKNGAIGLPFTIDPMVLYWNRDLFSAAGIANPPRYWDEFLTMSPKISRIDESKNVLTGFTALGEFGNVLHAKDILSLLFLQSDDAIISRGALGGLDTVFGKRNTANERPAESALRFYTEFSNPSKTVYSWNRSLPSSRDMFARGGLAVYFGYGGEITGLREKNPHLNFDIAPVPQVRERRKQKTFGRMTALAVAKNSSNVETAFAVAYALTGATVSRQIGDILFLPPARRDLLSETQTNAFGPVLYGGALMAHAWLDPDPNESYTIFKDMVESVSSGRVEPEGAVESAARQLGTFAR